MFLLISCNWDLVLNTLRNLTFGFCQFKRSRKSFNRRNHCQNNKTKNLLVTVFNKCSYSGKRPRTGRRSHKSTPGDSFCADRFENHWATKALRGFHLALYLLCPIWFTCLLYPVKIALLMQWSKPSHRPALHTCLVTPLVYEEDLHNEQGIGTSSGPEACNLLQEEHVSECGLEIACVRIT